MARKEQASFLLFDVPTHIEANYIFDVLKVFARSVYLTRQKLAPLKIGTRHYAAMAILASSNHSASQSTLVEKLGLSPNVVLAMVDYLDQLGYTRRVQNPRNRRENIVLLSKKGRRAYDRAVILLRRAEQELLAPLSSDEENQCQVTTRKLASVLPN